MTAPDNRNRHLGYAAGAVIAIAMVWWALRGVPVGDIDPLSAVIGAAALLVAVMATASAAKVSKSGEIDTVSLVAHLANEVARQEGLASQQLLGGLSMPIDLDFHFEPAKAHNAARAARHGSLINVIKYYN